MKTMIEYGHYRAEIDAGDLDDVQVKITMCTALETCEALLGEDQDVLCQDFYMLRMMVHEYITYLYRLREEALAYAV